MPDPSRFYRFLLKFYPARFREEYAAPLERQFRDEYRETPGGWRRTAFWLRALADLGTSIPRELGRELRQDLAYSARVYRQRSVTAVLAFVALALAIGATTGVFSVVNALLLRSLPYREPERLMRTWNAPATALAGRKPFTEWKRSCAYFEDIASYVMFEGTLGVGQEAGRVRVTETSSNWFQVLGAEPQFGRSFAADEDYPGRSNVAVISYSLWQQRFAGDPRMLGTVIRVAGVPLTVVGVAPPGADFPQKTEVWTPSVYEYSKLAKGASGWQNLGRLKQGMGLQQAAAMYETDVRRERPDAFKASGANRPRLIPLRDELAGPVRQASLVLLGVVVFVLLIACANVAHLLLSRATERRKELSMRAALGASRSRLVQQLMTESTVLTVAATAAGMGVAWWAARLAAAVQPAKSAAQEYTVLDWRVLGFAAGLALLTGLIFGVLPAGLIARMQPGEDLMRTVAGSHGRGARRMRSGLIVLQAAFSIVLLAASVTLGRSFLSLLGMDLGFRTDHVVTMTASLAGTPRDTEEGVRTYYREALDRLRAVPGVEAAGATNYLPLVNAMFMGAAFRPQGANAEKVALVFTVSPGYFQAMGAAIVRGRDFSDADTRGSGTYALVDEGFARQFADVDEMVGRTLVSKFYKQSPEVVGVVRTVFYSESRKEMPQIYILGGKSVGPTMTFAARVHGQTEPYLRVCRDALRSIDRGVPIFNVKTLDQRRADAVAQPRFYTTVVLFFAGFGLLLAVIGVYGAASFSIAQRTQEIGVRMAVGATPERMRVTLLGQSMLPFAAGIAAGVAVAIGFGRTVQHLLQNAEPVGSGVCALAGAVLAGTAAAAIWRAGRRIAQMDPIRILRAE